MSEHASSSRPPLAVVGISALFPGSTEVTGFWRDILAGRDLITEVPPSYWLVDDYYSPDPAAPDRTYCRRGAFLSPVPFDPLEFGLPPALLPTTDTSQILALVAAKQVLEAATRTQFASLDRSRASVILGVAAGLELVGEMASRLQRPVWVKALRESGLPEAEVQAICERIAAHYVPWKESTFPGLLGNVVAGRIANRFDLGGTNCTTDAACASSFSALAMAANELYLGDSDLVIAGGVDTTNDPFIYLCFSKTPALSPSGDCRPFSAKADGTMLGEGIGMVALRRLEDAERDGNQIYALIRGIGTSSDGRAKSVYAPRPEGQLQALERAYRAAGYSSATVELVEAHGTGTTAGDVAEFEALRRCFDGSGRADRQWCALGSIKSQIGHTKAAAGAAGLIKATLALHQRALPPTIKVEQPEPALAIDESPFYLNTQARPWVRGDAHPRRASVSSFGFGGTNFHVTLEEYRGPRRAPRLRTAPAELVLLGAESAAALAELCQRTGGEVGERPLAELARESQTRFDAGLPARLSLVAADGADLRGKLIRAAELIRSKGGEPLALPDGTRFAVGLEPGGVAFLFPGQGSQQLGMGGELALAFEEVCSVWDAHGASPLADGLRLCDVVFPRPAFGEAARAEQERRLTATEWAQPALGVASLGYLALLRRLGVQPSCAGGHSFGELTALCAAGVLSPSELVKVARRRGELMAAAAAVPGAMLALGQPRERVQALLEAWRSPVVIANHNSPRQVVLAGATAAVDELERRLAGEGIAGRRLPVATAFHSPVVAGSSAPFATFLEEVAVGRAEVPVYSNAEAAIYPADPAAIRRLLAEQIARPVRFCDELEAMVAAGARTFIEVGPGSVLSGLVDQCLEGRPHLAVPLDRRGQPGLVALWTALGQLSVQGVPLAYDRLWEPAAAAAPAKKKPALSVEVGGPNLGKLYPPAGGAAQLPPPNPPRAVAAVTVLPSPAAATALPSPTVAPRPLPQPQPAEPLAPPSEAWLQAFQELQARTAETHAACQRSMAESHQAFLRAAETSAAQLTALLGQPGLTRMVTPALELAAPLPPSQVAQSVAAPSQVAQPVAALSPRPTAQPVASPAPSPRPTAQPVAAPSPAPRPGERDLKTLLLSVVAEKTGYPTEILKQEMSLEADLGIDSIKRVEILSAVQERAPWLPEVEASRLPQLQTLGEVLGFLEELRPGAVAAPGVAAPVPQAPHLPQASSPTAASPTAASPTAASPTAASPTAAAAPAPAAVDLRALLLAVVAEKTGYPTEILNEEMGLEADLGIDSIKRVEILSAVQERLPWTPTLDAAEVSKLRTLGEVLGFMAQLGPGAAGAAAPAETAGAPRPAEGEAPARARLRAVATRASGEWTLRGRGPLCILDDGTGVAPALAERLRGEGLEVSVLGEVPPEAGVLIFLRGLRPLASEEAALFLNRDAFCAARAVAARSARAGAGAGAGAGGLVTVQDTGGDFALTCEPGPGAWSGGLAGLCKTAAREWPGAAVKAIDLQRGGRSPEELAAVLLEELLRGGPEVEVGLRADGRRVTLLLEPAAARPEPALPLQAGAVVVVTGGGRGITAAVLIELARRHPQLKLRFALLGRTALAAEPDGCQGCPDEPSLIRALLRRTGAGGAASPAELAARARSILAGREVQRTLAALQAAGAEARYLAVDVRDAAALGESLADVRAEWGPCAGLIHAAGVREDRLISDKSVEQFERVFTTKVQALQTLLEATRHDPLRLLCCFSSVAARFGNPGQADYAMANEVLNKVSQAEARRRPGCRVKSINWGPWDGGMVTPGLRGHFRALGVPLLQVDRGARLFLDELADPSGEVEVTIGGQLSATAATGAQPVDGQASSGGRLAPAPLAS